MEGNRHTFKRSIPSDDEDLININKKKQHRMNPGKICVINNIPGCAVNAIDVKKKFEDLGFDVMEKIDTYDELVQYFKDIHPSTPLIVFFFGYGFDDNIFLNHHGDDDDDDDDDDQIITYDHFSEIIAGTEKRKMMPLIFTNTLTVNTDMLEIRSRVTGDYENESLVTMALSRVLKNEKQDGTSIIHMIYNRWITLCCWLDNTFDQDKYGYDVRENGIYDSDGHISIKRWGD